jgi:hypothetical protein
MNILFGHILWGAFSHDGIGVADLAKLRYEEMTQSRGVGGKRCQLLFIATLKDKDKRSVSRPGGGAGNNHL